jgi:hypothetical protein
MKQQKAKQTTWYYIPEDRTLHNHWCENSNPTKYFVVLKMAHYITIGA